MLKWASSLWTPPLRVGVLGIRYKMQKPACKTARHWAEHPLWSSAPSLPSPQLQQRLNTKSHFLPSEETISGHILSHSHFTTWTTPKIMNPASFRWKALVPRRSPDLGWDLWVGAGVMIPVVFPLHGQGWSLGCWDQSYGAESTPSPHYFDCQPRQGKYTAIKCVRTLHSGDFISASVSSTEH